MIFLRFKKNNIYILQCLVNIFAKKTMVDRKLATPNPKDAHALKSPETECCLTLQKGLWRYD